MTKSHTVAVFVVLLFSGSFSACRAEVPASERVTIPEVARIKAILKQPESAMDFAKIKLTIDKMIDPSINVDAGLGQIDNIVFQIRTMLGSNPSNNEKMGALKKYLYEKGPWNGYENFHYDFDDPRGTKISNKLLPNYLASKKGNCVSMPLLFIVLGQRLGLDVTASTAPEHVFVKYTDPDTGITYSLETTSGAIPARDVWLQQQNPMTDESIANGIYLQKLTKRETVAVMATTLSENFSDKREPEKMIAIADAVLPYYPKNVSLILAKGSAYSRLIRRNYISKYPMPKDIPVEERPYFQHLSKESEFWYAKAEALGWRQPDKAQESRYMQVLNRAKSVQ
jgi:regulator of sirC expression with transglutaminase-like and TPR domain